MFNFTNAFIKTDSGDTITIKPEIKPTTKEESKNKANDT